VPKGQRKNQNEKYRLKYQRLRRAARTMIFENAALLNIYFVLNFFKFLLKSLLQYQTLSEGELLPTPSSSSVPSVPPAALTSAPAAGPSGSSLAHNPMSLVSIGEEGLLKKTKKERKDRGKENGKEECRCESEYISVTCSDR
uniref:Uncharacterized protein n=1 Tax=Xiphophorus couchianus TaxID=32473 RepID=A0A3B5KPJ8_9TELE